MMETLLKGSIRPGFSSFKIQESISESASVSSISPACFDAIARLAIVASKPPVIRSLVSVREEFGSAFEKVPSYSISSR